MHNTPFLSGRPQGSCPPVGILSSKAASSRGPRLLRTPIFPTLVATLVAGLCSLVPIPRAARAAAASGDAPLLGWEALARLDRLAEYKPPVHVGSVSSYDRTGGNDDGFSGKYSFVRKEADGLVIADLKGPGVIYRIWTPTPTDDWVEFRFDDESEPRLRVRFRDMFMGQTEPFMDPLAGHGVGGFFSYVPIPYARSCKVTIKAERIQFYQINYAQYAPGTGIRTFNLADAPKDLPRRDEVRRVWGMKGQDLASQTAPPGAKLETVKKRVTVAGGKTAVVYERKKPGRIVGLHLSPPDALGAKLRDVTLRISFDDQPASVLCPAADFFGQAWGDSAMRSLLVGTTERDAYCYFPMPFDRSVRVELISERPDATPIDLDARLDIAPSGRKPSEGRFGCLWRRENPTQLGKPFTFADFQGRGHLVGVSLQAQGFESGKTLFFEGDDATVIDGEAVVMGTGSEDFFNGGWYDVPDRWEKPLNFAMSGCLGYSKHLGRTGGYRFLVGDAYSFQKSIRQTIEHSGEKNDISTDYVGVTYFYSDSTPQASLPPAAQRAVNDPREIIFAAWWEIPIRAFAFQDSTLTRKAIRLAKEEVRFLSLRGGAPDWVGPAYLYVTCNLPAAGKYTVSIEGVRGPEQGVVQLFRDEVPVGEAVDMFAEEPAKSGKVRLATVPFEKGDNPVMLKLVRKNEKSKALGLDLIQVICERVD